MTDLHELLGRASDSPSPHVPVADDLARARTAMRRRRTGTGLAALATVLVLGVGVGVAQLGGEDETPRDAPVLGAPDPVVTPDEFGLVPSDITFAGLRVTKVPDGWEVQEQSDEHLVIAPTDGSVSDDPADLTGKYVLEVAGPDFESRRLGSGWTFAMVSPAADGSADERVLVLMPDSLDITSVNALVGAIEGPDGPLGAVIGDSTPVEEETGGVDPSLPLAAGDRVFHLGTAPDGWTFQGSNLNYALLAPADGSAGDEFGDFRGKIVVGLEARGTYAELSRGDGRTVTLDGREFYVWTGEDAIQVVVLTRAGEPSGTLRLQAPAGSLSEHQLVAFLDEVMLDEGAVPGVG